jgi:crotonobetainyl-CoA:carnitine CoA-transferase CaiB-like acyl-CoA transferase
MGALDGLLVVALEQAVAAPLCTARLADAGARVIKIERAEGDTARHYDGAVHGTSAYFAWLNRGKESLVADVKEAADRALVERMLARADVFVQNLAPGAAARLGLDARSLVARRPSLVAVDICGYASDTPAQDKRAYDMLVQAESGVCAVTGTAEAMVKVGIPVADITTGLNAHAAVLEALFDRVRTGAGRAIEIAMFDVMADCMAVPLLHWTGMGRDTPRCGLEHATITPYAAYACRDGAVMLAIQAPAEWIRFCAGVLGNPALATDARFAENMARTANRAALAAIIGARFAALSHAEVIALLTEHRIAWGQVSTVPMLAGHAALRQAPVAVPGGSARLPRPPGRSDALPVHVPALDADGFRIRAEFAGADAVPDQP